MAEYIERAETAEFFEKSKQTMWHKDDIAATISSKKNIPSADVVEVVHGEWVRGMGSYTRIKCSRCEWTKPYIEDFYEAELLSDMSYCPNCGAKMDGDKNG